MSQRPGTRNLPRASTIRAPRGGTRRGATATIRSPRIRTSARCAGPSESGSTIAPPARRRVGSGGGAAGRGAAQERRASAAARAPGTRSRRLLLPSRADTAPSALLDARGLDAVQAREGLEVLLPLRVGAPLLDRVVADLVQRLDHVQPLD